MLLASISILLALSLQRTWAAPVKHVQSNFTTDQSREGSNVTYPLPGHVVYDFPTATWIENIAVRPNGHLLLTEETHPRLYQIDPFNPHSAILVHEFPNVTSLLGIVETSPDVFHICTTNTTAASLGIYEEQNIFKVDMRAFSSDRVGSAEVSEVATVSQARFLNGMAFLGEESGVLLASDSYAGVIWNIDIQTGESRIAINSTYTQPMEGSRLGLGVNGIRNHNRFLYFTNTDQMTLVKVAINNQGEAVGDYQVLANATFAPDDFAINAAGDAYVTNAMPGANGLLFVPREGGEAIPIAGMAGPTSAAFGRMEADRDVVYVCTSGGDAEYMSGGPVDVSGKVVRVDVRRDGS